MRTALAPVGLAIILTTSLAAAGQSVPITSPGFAASRMDAQGRLVEDWGTVAIRLSGEGVVDGPVTVEAIQFDGVIPAARAVSSRGAAELSWTAYRAPAFPAGVDVLTVAIRETQGRVAEVTVAIDAPAAGQIGSRTLRIGGRTVLTLPSEAVGDRELRDWGHCDEAVARAGWAKPQGTCDPALHNIRAGMGGVPIEYRFAVKPKSRANVVLGFCESHWAEPRRRPLACRVEGAPPQQVDPVGQWGQHKPGAVLFEARDENGDGRLEIAVNTPPGAGDRNPILNAIWIFPAREAPNLDEVISGSLSATAVRYVDVGGDNDQSIYPPGKLEYRLSLPAGGTEELVFLVACPGGASPIPDVSPWTVDALRRAAFDVWRDWPGQ